MRGNEVTQHEMHFETHAARDIFVFGPSNAERTKWKICIRWIDDDQTEYLLFAFGMPTKSDVDACATGQWHATPRGNCCLAKCFSSYFFLFTFLNGSNINHTSLKPITAWQACHSVVHEKYIRKRALLTAKLISSPFWPGHILSLHRFTRQVFNQSVGGLGAFRARVYLLMIMHHWNCIFALNLN